MEVTVAEYTNRPIDEISKAAGTSYGRRDVSEKRMLHCFNNGHMSVFEFANVTFYIEGISRACSHQLVRHRHMSFVQKSQRYTTIRGDNWYVIPPSIEENERYARTYKRDMQTYYGNFNYALCHGIKPEDARFLLPEATKTDITVSTNVRELFHFLDLRCAPSAQWEIRALAEGMKDACRGINDQWKRIIELWEFSEREEMPQG